MARARNIKPGFYKNEDLAECSVWARFIFPGLWMLADREGRLEDRPKRIKGELLPFDSQDVEPLLSELQARGFIVRYQKDGQRFIQISKFSKHQTPHYTEKESLIPAPELQESNSDDGDKTPGGLQEDSRSEEAIKTPSLPPDSLIHRFTDSPNPDLPNPDSPKALPSGSKGARTRRPRSPEVPLPEGFEVSGRVRQWAEEHGHGNLPEHFDAFVLKARAKGYRYADWDAAFMEAIRANWARVGEAQRVVPLRNESTYEHNVRVAEEWLRNG